MVRAAAECANSSTMAHGALTSADRADCVQAEGQLFERIYPLENRARSAPRVDDAGQRGKGLTATGCGWLALDGGRRTRFPPTGGRIMHKAILTFVALSMTACASSGTKVDQSSLQQFQKGQTTLPQIVAALGEPTSTITRDDGTKIVTYSYAQYQTRPETFIPYIWPLVGGGDTHTSAVVFNFDASDVLQSYATETSNT